MTRRKLLALDVYCRAWSVLWSANVAILAEVSCTSKISGKLQAGKVIPAQDQGKEIEEDGVKVSVPAGAFAEPTAVAADPTDTGLKIATERNGVKVLSVDVLEDVHYRSLYGPNFEQNRVHIPVTVTESEPRRQDSN